jgi:hypothetical protein
MSTPIHKLLTELEDLSARAIADVEAGELIAAADSIRLRGEALARLDDALAAAGPVSYEEWNRLVVIHFQGNRALQLLTVAKEQLSAEAVESSREQALLQCVAGVVLESTTASVSETA